MTSNTSEFSKCFQNMLPLSKQINNWLRVLSSYSSKAFKKIRIKSPKTKGVTKELVTLIDKRNRVDKDNEREALDNKIADKEAEEKT